MKADDIAPLLRRGVQPISCEVKQYILGQVDNALGLVTIYLRRPECRSETGSWFFGEEGSSRKRTSSSRSTCLE